MKRLITSTLATLLALSVSTEVFAANKLTRDELKIGIAQEFENLNPIISTMVASRYIYNMTGRALSSMDAKGKWYPQLAKKLPSLKGGDAKLITVKGKDGKDMKTIQAVWQIREEAKWSDGKPVVCADFALARQIADSPNVSVGSKDVYTQIAKIEWDPKTPQKCTFTYDKARWDFDHLPDTYPVPAHLEESVFKAHGSENQGYEKNTTYNKAPSTQGLYNGPYMVADIKLGSHVSLVPNPHFYGKKPNFKKILIKLIPNTSTLEVNLRSGNIDKVASLGFSFDQALAFEKKVHAEKLAYKVLFKPSLTYEHIDLDLNNPILTDVRVRKALVYALNRPDLVRALFDGKQQAAIHNMAEIDPWFTKDPKKITIYPYDKKRAGLLLDEAGWKVGAGGYRFKDGKKLSLQFMTTAENKTREMVQTYLMNNWKSIGVEVLIKNEPARVFFGETMKKRKYNAMAMYAWVSSPESTPRSTFHSHDIPSEKNGWSGQNTPGWSNAKVDELIEKLEVEFDSKKRTEYAQNILKYYTDEVPVIPLYYRSDLAVIPADLKNFELSGHQFSEANFVETWDL